MRCPRCADVELHTEATLGGVEADLCTRCHGVWLDDGELEALLGRPPDASLERAGAVSHTACPRCDVQWLQTLSLSGRPALSVDRCPDCRGIWLDAGELAGLRARLPSDHAAAAATAPVLRPQDEPPPAPPHAWLALGWLVSVVTLIAPYLYLRQAWPGHVDLPWQYPLCALAYVALGWLVPPAYDRSAFQRAGILGVFGYRRRMNAAELRALLTIALFPGQVVAWTLVTTWTLARDRVA